MRAARHKSCSSPQCAICTVKLCWQISECKLHDERSGAALSLRSAELKLYVHNAFLPLQLDLHCCHAGCVGRLWPHEGTRPLRPRMAAAGCSQKAAMFEIEVLPFANGKAKRCLYWTGTNWRQRTIAPRDDPEAINWTASWCPHAVSSTLWQDVNPLEIQLDLVTTLVEGELWQVKDIMAVYRGHRYKLVYRDYIFTESSPVGPSLRPCASSTMRDTPEQLCLKTKAELGLADVLVLHDLGHLCHPGGASAGPSCRSAPSTAPSCPHSPSNSDEIHGRCVQQGRLRASTPSTCMPMVLAGTSIYSVCVGSPRFAPTNIV